MTVVLNQSFTGISIGAVLLLIALGLTLTFGQMGVINMAHGEFIMAGAYTTYVLQKSISSAGVSLLVALPLLIDDELLVTHGRVEHRPGPRDLHHDRHGHHDDRRHGRRHVAR